MLKNNEDLMIIDSTRETFKQENIANYNTSETMLVSGVVTKLFMNEGVLKENMRLCKNNDNANIDDFFILLYPVEEGYKVVLLNLIPKQAISDDISFHKFVYYFYYRLFSLTISYQIVATFHLINRILHYKCIQLHFRVHLLRKSFHH